MLSDGDYLMYQKTQLDKNIEKLALIAKNMRTLKGACNHSWDRDKNPEEYAFMDETGLCLKCEEYLVDRGATGRFGA